MGASRIDRLNLKPGYELFLYHKIHAFWHFTGHDVAEGRPREELQAVAGRPPA